jgi:hypothetical protein
MRINLTFKRLFAVALLSSLSSFTLSGASESIKNLGMEDQIMGQVEESNPASIC